MVDGFVVVGFEVLDNLAVCWFTVEGDVKVDHLGLEVDAGAMAGEVGFGDGCLRDVPVRDGALEGC